MAETILLADESDTMRRVAQLTLADQGFHVISVSDGQQALEAFEAERPSAALISLTLPLLDGWSLARTIRGRPASADIPIVLLAGAFEPIDEARVRSSGAAGVLVKPYEAGLVIDRVKELLRMSSPAPERAADTPQAPISGRQVTGDEGTPANEVTPHPAHGTEFTDSTGSVGVDDPFGTLNSIFGRPESAQAPYDDGAAPSFPEGAHRVAVVPAEESPWLSQRGSGHVDAGAGAPQATFASPPSHAAFGGAMPAADAFAALLAAEQGEAPPPPPLVAGPIELSNDTLAQLAALVVEHLAERTSHGVAERISLPVSTRVAGEVSISVTDAVPARIVDRLTAPLADALTAPVAARLGAQLSDGLAERVAALVAERMMQSAFGDTLRATVHDVAERLVRDEIDRLRQRAASR